MTCHCAGPVACRPWSRHPRGAVLAVVLLLLVVLALLGTSAMLMATLELRMAANYQHQARAFEAAEYGIEAAMRAPDLATTYTPASPKIVPASGAAPQVPGSPTDAYSYRLYLDSSAGTGSVPDAAAVGPGVAALHFIVEAIGTSSRGARDTHAQSFYLLVPATCAAGGAGCPPLSSYAPIRTVWSQQDAE